ncbi:PAS domain S-box-containing protein [Palleronia aestuarii]|uniref:histidine kinase n=1 Tax=Palleronia aestuarii TaxID=568105 RepID=A0A2W7NGN4_9RHOB|nr:PAS domain-containing protein [Palleronia aestuarii]PZX19030.1 PAS domain S-box-containing protein [Palleronia aestuarii]
MKEFSETSRASRTAEAGAADHPHTERGPHMDRSQDSAVDTEHLMIHAMEQARMAICISDPSQEDCPIISINQAFADLTGYSREEIIGRNCRFLQGDGTDPAQIDRIREAIRKEEVRVFELLNYKKDGTPFWNSLHIGPIYDDEGRLSHFYGSQWDVTDIVEERERIAVQASVAEELQHRTANLFSVINAIIRLTARDENIEQSSIGKILDRIEALRNAHSTTMTGGQTDGSDNLLRLAQITLAPYVRGDYDAIVIEAAPMVLPPRIITPLGMAIHELATNALKYGALSRDQGQVHLTWQRSGHEIIVTWTESGGPTLSGKPAVRGTGIGARIINSVIAGAGGRIALDWRHEGLVATIHLPVAWPDGQRNVWSSRRDG